MSSDAKEAKTYNGDKKEDWKAFYDEAVRICRQELGSAGVEWFNGEVEKITGQNLQRVIHDEYYLICKTGKVTYAGPCLHRRKEGSTCPLSTCTERRRRQQ